MNTRHKATRAALVALAETLQREGLRCYWSDESRWQTFMYVGDDTGVAYVQHDWMDGWSVNTVHVPNSDSGTGFRIADTARVDDIQQAIKISKPHWYQHGEPVTKYPSIDAYLEKRSNLIPVSDEVTA